MAFANQFALSIELTRLLPILGWAAHETADTIMNFARDLRHSGSDFVVERDLANVLGRCRISETLTSSFRTVVANSSSNISLVEAITLQGGPGPTVLRAFQELPYFSMVVQLSLLVWTFDANYLATALSESLRRRAAGAPPSSVLQMSPDRSGILGVLKACESQTSSFNWNFLLDAVSTTLDYQADKAPKDFSPVVLQGLLDMFPMVQTLPNDRLIHIQIPVGESLDSGITALVVWAHHVLGLTVLVQICRDKRKWPKIIRFGDSESDQVFIEEVSPEDDPSVTLLDSQKEHLLKIKPEPESEHGLIGTVRRIPARGWGNALIKDSVYHSFRVPSEAIIEDLPNVASAFAFIIAKHLVRDECGGSDFGNLARIRSPNTMEVDQQHLLQAARFLFDNVNLDRGEIDSYVAEYSLKPLDRKLPRPDKVLAKQREYVKDDEWDMSCGLARELAILLLALAHVVGLEDCGDLMIAGLAFDSMSQHPLAKQLQEWEGKDFLRVADDAWLQAIAVPLIGHQNREGDFEWGKVCLVSDHGWSAWISTLANVDPVYTQVGSVHLGRGSPCRDGIWKTGIRDSEAHSWSFETKPERVESCGQVASLRSAHKVTLETPYCGEREDAFWVCARFRLPKTSPKQSSIKRRGYRELHRCLWWARISERCSHGGPSHASITLPVGCATFAGFGEAACGPNERILIFLTAHSVGARWLTLAALPWVREKMDVTNVLGVRQCLIRRDDCCFQCVIDQAAAWGGKLFVIL